MSAMKREATFFIAGGVVFLFVSMILREVDNDAANIVGLTFGIIGICWVVPQLIIHFARRDK